MREASPWPPNLDPQHHAPPATPQTPQPLQLPPIRFYDPTRTGRSSPCAPPGVLSSQPSMVSPYLPPQASAKPAIPSSPLAARAPAAASSSAPAPGSSAAPADDDVELLEVKKKKRKVTASEVAEALDDKEYKKLKQRLKEEDKAAGGRKPRTTMNEEHKTWFVKLLVEFKSAWGDISQKKYYKKVVNELKRRTGVSIADDSAGRLIKRLLEQRANERGASGTGTEASEARSDLAQAVDAWAEVVAAHKAKKQEDKDAAEELRKANLRSSRHFRNSMVSLSQKIDDSSDSSITDMSEDSGSASEADSIAEVLKDEEGQDKPPKKPAKGKRQSKKVKKKEAHEGPVAAIAAAIDRLVDAQAAMLAQQTATAAAAPVRSQEDSAKLDALMVFMAKMSKKLEEQEEGSSSEEEE